MNIKTAGMRGSKGDWLKRQENFRPERERGTSERSILEERKCFKEVGRIGSKRISL